MPVRAPEDDDAALAQVRDLVDRLLSPAPMSEFLAHRERVRRGQPRGALRQLK